jgi:hypothetical protein
MPNNKHKSSDLWREQTGIHRAITTNHYTTRFGAGAPKVVTESLRENFGEAELAKLNEIVVVTKILEVTKGSPQRKGRYTSFWELGCLAPLFHVCLPLRVIGCCRC